jgi:hypothetical protein
MLKGKNKYLLTTVLLLTVLSDVLAQKFEVGVLAGGSYYYGDIVNELELSTIKASGGVFLRYHLNDKWKIKVFAAYAKVGGADSNSTSAWQKSRNLDFTSDIYEGSVQVEYCFLEDNTRGRRIKNKVIPYVFGGVGAFWFNPQSTAYGTKVNLISYQTNGVKYNQYAACAPFGAGVKYKITQQLSVGLEFGIRYTFTSFLDDVDGNNHFRAPDQYAFPNTIYYADRSKYPRNDDGSTTFSIPGSYRGKMGNIQDVYMIYGLTLSYRFGSSGGGGGYKGRAIRCPRFY